MIQHNPSLKLNRLIIFTKSGKIAYDEKFHEGVNIIRGHNSSGKSTISNFIFYALGGDFKKWTTSAQECGHVYAEISINSSLVTFKRTISESGGQPMSIFWGAYEESIKEGEKNWQIFPYRRSESKKSFSNALFLALNFPELRGDFDSNITMHQILRLLYIDQKSLTLNFLMTEEFDSSITRKTIADLLFGVYDDELYSNQIELKKAEKDFSIKKKQFEGIEGIFESSEGEVSSLIINGLIEENNRELAKLGETIDNYDFSKNQKIEESNVGKEMKITNIKNALIRVRKDFSDLQSQIGKYEFEIIDSKHFIVSLERRAKALSDSLLTRDAFYDLKINNCPICLLPLNVSEESHCLLCKQELSNDKASSQAKRMQQEIDNQIRESKKILEEKEGSLLKLKASLPTRKLEIEVLKSELNEELSFVKDDRSQEYDNLLIRKGELKSKNDYLIKQLKTLEQIEVLKKELDTLSSRIEILKEEIKIREKTQRKRLDGAYELIENYTLRLLDSDLGRQEEFHRGKSVEIDFERNTFSLDRKNNFSESSNVYLKNSVRFAAFFASLDKESFRYPRFILCDNIEDKGMEPERSQSFQHELVKISLESEVSHQIIITTSMIASDLNNTDFCVGTFYTEKNKTLNLD